MASKHERSVLSGSGQERHQLGNDLGEGMAELADLAEAAEAGEFSAADALERAPDLPDDLRQVWAELYAQPHSMRAVLAEDDAIAESLAQAAASGSLGNILLVVLVHGRGISEIPPTRGDGET